VAIADLFAFGSVLFALLLIALPVGLNWAMEQGAKAKSDTWDVDPSETTHDDPFWSNSGQTLFSVVRAPYCWPA
jgi:hypothetical protein